MISASAGTVHQSANQYNFFIFLLIRQLLNMATMHLTFLVEKSKLNYIKAVLCFDNKKIMTSIIIEAKVVFLQRNSHSCLEKNDLRHIKTLDSFG